MKTFNLLSLIIVSVSLIFIGADNSGKKKGKNQVTTNDFYNYIAVNECTMWVGNNGDGSHNPMYDNPGFYWPKIDFTYYNQKVPGIPAVYEDGLMFAGKYKGEIRANGNTHRQGLQAGKILADGTADDPSKEKYRVYKIYKYWEDLPPGPRKDAYEKDYNQWPVEDGAPWIDTNGDGIFTSGVDEPQHIGDETLWYVSNDLDSNRTRYTYGTLPMGLEFQVTVFAFDRANFLKDVVFKKYKMINKGSETIKDMYLIYWSDTDLGNGGDDAVGCDTTLNLAFVYNGDETDENFYETKPPALGYKLLQGPIIKSSPADKARYNFQILEGFKNLPMTSFICFENRYLNVVLQDPSQGTSEGSIQYYNYCLGLDYYGNPIIAANVNKPTKFCVPGDPVNGTGWYWGEGWPGSPAPSDVRQVMCSGPFDLAPQDTQEVVIGIIMAQGNDRLDSVRKLKFYAEKLQLFYDNFQPETPEPIIELPENYFLGQNYPNPFNPSTTIEYSIPTDQFVEINLFNILGEKVAALVNEQKTAGYYKINFSSNGLPSGIYIYRIEVGPYKKSRKMIVLK